MKLSLFQTILFGVFAFAAVIGLFTFATYSNKGSTNAVGTVLIWGTLPGTAMTATLNAAQQTDQTMKAVTYVQKDPATLASDLASAIATGAAPDAILASQELLKPLAKFLTPIPLATLSARTFQSAFVEGGNIFAAPGNQGYYGVPFLIDPIALFTNRAILSSSGIAQPPATWEALVGLVPRTAKLTASRQVSRGLIALGTYDNVHDARGILSTLFIQTGVGVAGYSAAGVPVANLGSADGQAGQAVVGFYTQFTDPSKVSYTWNASLPDSQQAFLSGDLALYLGYASEARFIRAANPNLDMDMVPVPQPATANGKSTYGLVYAFMFPRGARNSAGAYQAAANLTNSAAQATAAANTGLAPASLSQLSQAPADATAAVAYSEALYAKGWLSPAPADTDAVFSAMIGNVISGRLNLQAALAGAERSLTALLQP